MDDHILKSLLELRLAMLGAASEDTANSKQRYQELSTKSLLADHCGPASFVVQQRYGGQIMVGRLSDGTPHYWNRLPDGTEVDLTSDQFGGDGINPVAQGRAAPPRKGRNQRFEKFQKRVDAEIDA